MRLSTPTSVVGKKLGYIKAIEMIAAAGFDAFDLSMGDLHKEERGLSSDDYLENLAKMKAAADACGIVCNQAHAPFPSQKYANDDYNDMMFRNIVRSMECAAYMGADIIVVHPVTEPNYSVPAGDLKIPFESFAQKFEYNIAFFKRLLPYCE